MSDAGYVFMPGDGNTCEAKWALCKNERHGQGPFCKKHGCYECGAAILADTEEWPMPLCAECFEGMRNDD